MKKVDFFREWAKQFEPGYKGPWMIDNMEPDDLFFCGCCCLNQDGDLEETPQKIQNNEDSFG
jgi:hypothetical protein